MSADSPDGVKELFPEARGIDAISLVDNMNRSFPALRMADFQSGVILSAGEGSVFFSAARKKRGKDRLRACVRPALHRPGKAYTAMVSRGFLPLNRSLQSMFATGRSSGMASRQAMYSSEG